MSGQEQAEVTSTGDESATDSEDAAVIIERQMQVVRRLNDELLRTIRTQAVAGAGLITLVSLIDAQLFLPQSGGLLWVVGFFLTFLSFLGWYNHLGAARVSYTDLQMGVHSEIGENNPIEPAEPDSPIEQFKSFFSRAALHLPIVISTFAGGSLTISQFEEEIDRDEAHRLVAADASEGIRHNNWVLRTRERYVDAVRGYLTWTFLLVMLGVLLMVVY